ncbi:Uncharacterised protein family (UPF0180) [Natronincola peptidivorans]|uniref:Uncharacterized protein family (UPF0180) n=1 Tax=Natronincola peptidivorans TaxID=426128 RepID=A0A1I0GHD5_9FIRM|nr:YkuS family protein [Natronincola peptidivorans]SET69513.1 Uncharacterised protein family (UPF0180) [Natronincola peptidivorans]
MKRKVAVEGTLNDVKGYLQEKGYEVEELNNQNNNLNNYDAIIITGQDSNVLGMEKAVTKSPIITARGQSAEEIYKQIENRMK